MQHQTLPRLNDPRLQQDLFDAPIIESPALDTDFGLSDHLENYGYKPMGQAAFLAELNRADAGKRSYIFFGSKIADATKASLIHADTDKFCNHSVELSRPNTEVNFEKAVAKLDAFSAASTHQYITLNTAYRGGPGGRKEGYATVLSWYSLDFDLPRNFTVRACSDSGELHLHNKKTLEFIGVYDPVAEAEAIRCTIEASGLLPPQYIVFTGNGFQVHWRVSPKNGWSNEVKRRRDTLQAMHARIQSVMPADALLKLDACPVDALRYFRLPGSVHGRTGQRSQVFNNDYLPEQYNTDDFQAAMGVTPTYKEFDSTPIKRTKKPKKKQEFQPDFKLVINNPSVPDDSVVTLEWHGLIPRYKAHNKRVYEHFKQHAPKVKEGHRHTLLNVFVSYSMLHHNNPNRAARELMEINESLAEPMNRSALLKSFKGAIDNQGYRYRRVVIDSILAEAGLPPLPQVSSWVALPDEERKERQRQGQQAGCETKINETLRRLLKAAEECGLDDKEAIARKANRCLATVYKYADQLAEILANKIAAKVSNDKGLQASFNNFYLSFSKGSVCVLAADIARYASSERAAFKAALDGRALINDDSLSRTRRSRQNRTQMLCQMPEIRAEVEALGINSKPLARLLHALVYERLFSLLIENKKPIVEARSASPAHH